MDKILEFLAGIPGDVWNLIPSLGGPGWAVTAIKTLIGLAGLTAFSRIIPDKWLYVPITQFFDKIGLVLYVPGYAIGKTISSTGRKLLGRNKWERVEEQVVQKAIGLLHVAIFDGLTLMLQRAKNGPLDGLDADDPGANIG